MKSTWHGTTAIRQRICVQPAAFGVCNTNVGNRAKSCNGDFDPNTVQWACAMPCVRVAVVVPSCHVFLRGVNPFACRVQRNLCGLPME